MEIVVWVCGSIRHEGTIGSLREVLGVWGHLSKEDTVSGLGCRGAVGVGWGVIGEDKASQERKEKSFSWR